MFEGSFVSSSLRLNARLLPAMGAATKVWWRAQCGPDAYPIIAAACHAWALLFERRAGGRLIVEDGGEFGGANFWWGKRRPRPAPHEGVDFCEILVESCRERLEDATATPEPRASLQRVPVGFTVPAVADGEVVAMFDDFVARTIVMQHHEEIKSGLLSETVATDTKSWLICSLLAHVEPVPGLALGSHVIGAGPCSRMLNVASPSHQELAPVAAVAAPRSLKTTSPPHVHLSLLAAPRFRFLVHSII